MSHGTEVETDFAAMMQELSLQAADKGDDRVASGISVLISGIHSLSQRLEALEETVVRKLEATQFQRIEQQLTAIRDTESVNQKLFDSLHSELISYRDNFVRDALQKPFIRDLLSLFDDLTKIVAQAETPQLRENLENVLHFVIEICHRLEVTAIESSDMVDRTLQRVVSVEPTSVPEENGQIVSRGKRGFLWQGKVLRPEEVVVRRYTAPADPA